MTDLDCFLSIGIHADFNKTLLLAQTCSYIHKNIWKLKLKHYFPNKKYFNFWTGSQNYLVRNKKFILMIEFDEKYVRNVFYESNTMLNDFMWDNFYSKGLPEYITFNISRRFILVRNEGLFQETFLVGQYDSKKRALMSAEKNQKKYLNTKKDKWSNYFFYVIIDLKCAVPKFWQMKNNNTKIPNENTATFYSGIFPIPIKF
jgi:hypothetical protein